MYLGRTVLYYTFFFFFIQENVFIDSEVSKFWEKMKATGLSG